jgi:hypothetical protein
VEVPDRTAAEVPDHAAAEAQEETGKDIANRQYLEYRRTTKLKYMMRNLNIKMENV